METTVCSSMHCYKKAAIDKNSGLPPFCDDCKKKRLEQTQKAEA